MSTVSTAAHEPTRIAPVRGGAAAGPAIEAVEIAKTYPGDVQALRGVSFDVSPGTVFGLLGPNGAGKSTTVKILTTLSQATSGRATVAGFDVTRQPRDVRHAIGSVAQKAAVDPQATGLENLVLAGRLYGMRGASLHRRAHALLERFGLTDAAHRIVRSYSGGMARRLDVAMGLVHRPAVLFLDELRDACYLAGRDIRALLRQPWYVAVTLVQPVIWLVLFGQMFGRFADFPGFGAPNYVDYLTPGVVVMTALYSNGWAGMSYILDMEGGVLDRFLVTPVSRGAMIAGRLMHASLLTLIQSLIILALGAATGASFSGGVLPVLAFLAAAILLGTAFASASCALALLLRRQEVVIAVVNFFVLPLSFLSSAFVPTAMLPGWIQAVTKVNPVNWAVEVGRQAVEPTGPGGTVDWSLIGSRLALLAALAAVAGTLSTRAFRSYQRSA